MFDSEVISHCPCQILNRAGHFLHNCLWQRTSISYQRCIALLDVHHKGDSLRSALACEGNGNDRFFNLDYRCCFCSIYLLRTNMAIPRKAMSISTVPTAISMYLRSQGRRPDTPTMYISGLGKKVFRHSGNCIQCLLDSKGLWFSGCVKSHTQFC